MNKKLDNKTERLAELGLRLGEMTAEMNKLDRFDKKNTNKIVKYYKEIKSIEKEGKELLR